MNGRMSRPTRAGWHTSTAPVPARSGGDSRHIVCGRTRGMSHAVASFCGTPGEVVLSLCGGYNVPCSSTSS